MEKQNERQQINTSFIMKQRLERAERALGRVTDFSTTEKTPKYDRVFRVWLARNAENSISGCVPAYKNKSLQAREETVHKLYKTTSISE
jgi:hypothetical protein